jgi:hypothetical protein
MNKIDKLHTAIRRFCMENEQFWWDKYVELYNLNEARNGFDYTHEFYSIFPRFKILNAILTEIEKVRADDFSNFGEAKDYFCLATNQANNVFTSSPSNEIERQVINEERQKVFKFISQLNESALSKVKPLFYRRVLSTQESKDLREKLKSIWKVDGYWFPLAPWKPQNTEAFQDKYFEEEFGSEKTRQILHNLGVRKIWEVREREIDHEIELSVVEFGYDQEAFWFDETFDWLIYASHESSITFAGSILPEIKKNWPNWQKRLWDSPFFD